MLRRLLDARTRNASHDHNEAPWFCLDPRAPFFSTKHIINRCIQISVHTIARARTHTLRQQHTHYAVSCDVIKRCEGQLASQSPLLRGYMCVIASIVIIAFLVSLSSDTEGQRSAGRPVPLSCVHPPVHTIPNTFKRSINCHQSDTCKPPSLSIIMRLLQSVTPMSEATQILLSRSLSLSENVWSLNFVDKTGGIWQGWS